MKFLIKSVAIISILIFGLFVIKEYNKNVIKEAANSVVSLRAMTSSGTGVVISPTRIITACHVVNTIDNVEITTLYGKVVRGNVILCNEETDIAFIDIVDEKLEHVSNISCYNYDVDFEQYFSIGHPLGAKNILKHGYITGINENTYSYQGLIYMGDSGSAVFNRYGNIVGIVQTTLLAEIPNSFGMPNRIFLGTSEIFKSSKICELYSDYI